MYVIFSGKKPNINDTSSAVDYTVHFIVIIRRSWKQPDEILLLVPLIIRSLFFLLIVRNEWSCRYQSEEMRLFTRYFTFSFAIA